MAVQETARCFDPTISAAKTKIVTGPPASAAPIINLEAIKTNMLAAATAVIADISIVIVQIKSVRFRPIRSDRYATAMPPIDQPMKSIDVGAIA